MNKIFHRPELVMPCSLILSVALNLMLAPLAEASNSHDPALASGIDEIFSDI